MAILLATTLATVLVAERMIVTTERGEVDWDRSRLFTDLHIDWKKCLLVEDDLD